MTTRNILVVDDHPLLRKGLNQLLRLDDNIHMIYEASNGFDAVKQAEELQPDLILLDLNMAELNGLETLKALKKAKVSSKIIIFTVCDDKNAVISAIKLGADGYLLKDMEPEELLKKLQKVYEGDFVVSEQLTGIIAKVIRGDHDEKDLIALLTEKEKEILKLISGGDSNKLIGRKLGIMESTVKVHVKHLLKKLKLKSRVEAAVWVVENQVY